MIIGHQKQVRLLKKMIEAKKIPHALLFSGPEKLGKRTIALEMTSWLLKEPPKTHPDFIFIEPLKKERGLGQIQIEQIREFSWRLNLKPIKADLIIGVINDAHLMTKEAQNCFLKTLEEPKTNALLILISHYPNLLLPTILSRCTEIKFYPLSRAEITKLLEEKGINANNMESLIEISLGRPGVIIDLFSNPQKWEERKFWLGQLNKLYRLSVFERFQLAKKLSQSEVLKEILEDWLVYFRHLLIKKALAKNLPFLNLKNIIEKIHNTLYLISMTNINPISALEILMLEL